MDKKNEHQINIELSDEVAEGIYSNLAVITHSHSEFIVDFVKIMPGIPKAKVKARIILTPQHAKRLLNALKDNVQKFEESFGKIEDNSPGDIMPFNFGGPAAQA
jgi:predicted transcriptional regulator